MATTTAELTIILTRVMFYEVAHLREYFNILVLKQANHILRRLNISKKKKEGRIELRLSLGTCIVNIYDNFV
jgi:hypothetical protein